MSSSSIPSSSSSPTSHSAPKFGTATKDHPISGAALRQAFLRFFENEQHFVAKSSPLLPAGDATLLFTNAGMVQFKDVFTGKEKRPYTRATSSQKCVRAGGKHNDLENVGRTARHHTFFEMLGNFSFGDYFKVGAIQMAWRFLTEELGIPKDRLTVTVFGGDEVEKLPADEEAESIWRDVVGVPAERIHRHGKKDNFWAMGDTGPCGPCTEIHFDRGRVEGAFGGDDPEGDQILEVWNLVFMQFERHADGTLTPLPAPCVDTGMGLERLTMVMNSVASNYDTDLLRPLIKFSEDALGKTYTSTDSDDDVAMRVISDHARTTSFLIADGVFPSNKDRGYVLRRIMRRAINFGDKLGFKEAFFTKACLAAVELFSHSHPELIAARPVIERLVELEERTFRSTLKKGLALFNEEADKVSADASNVHKLFDGATVFKLYETYGFPTDLTELLCKERNLHIDWESYKTAESLHKERSAGGLGLHGVDDVYKEIRNKQGATVFTGYDAQTGTGNIVALLRDGELVEALVQGEKGVVILDRTPFYGESGGQTGDAGLLTGPLGRANVETTKKEAGLHVHHVEVIDGVLTLSEKIDAVVDNTRLGRIRRNHSATHLLHYALRRVLGDHVTQKGSLVEADRLRFDFSHFEPMTQTQIDAVEDLVNDLIQQNIHTDVENTSFDAAKEKGAMALFGEKYGDEVRVVQFGPSVELCGGIHVHRTGDIGLCKITSEAALAAGVRRIEAVTGMGALAWVREQNKLLATTAQALKTGVNDVPARIEKLKDDLRAAEKQVESLVEKAQAAEARDLVKSAEDVGGVKLLAHKLPEMETKALRSYSDKLIEQLKSGVVVLGLPAGADKCTLLVAVSKDLTSKVHAGKMVGELAAIVGGKGGGKPDFAQAGGSKPDQLDAAFAKARALLQA